MKKRIFLTFTLLAALVLGGCSSTGTQTAQDTDGSVQQDTAQTETQAQAEGIGTHHAEITIAGKGTISVELDGDAAPITVQNFMDLAESGFYDGLTFHRIIPGFMIQGGCPLGNGTGGPGWKIKGEFAANGVANPIKHTRGVVSMARAADPNSAGSQFFIMHQDAPHLDGQYAAFGKVVSGMDVVDKIASVKTDWNDKPTTPVRMKTVEIIEG